MFQEYTENFLKGMAITLLAGLSNFAQALDNPYRNIDNWAQLPGGRTMGAVGDLKVDPDGEHIWAIVRCDAGLEFFGSECLESNLDPILKFSQEGVVVKSFGGGMFIWPHGIDVDADGNVWVTDAAWKTDGKRGHQVIKFSPEGKVLMTLGTPGVAGRDHKHFNQPADVVVAENGDIFVADGHAPGKNNRVVKFSSDGTYLTEWGKTGYAPGEFNSLHAIAIDPDGKLYVADRANQRIQIFDQTGKFLNRWTQFGSPSGIFFDAHGRVYVSDSESDNVSNPGWEIGIRIGEGKTGWVSEFIRYPWADPREPQGAGAEFVTVDRFGNIYGAEPGTHNLQKYERVKP